jgi:hypothetical protein
MYACGGHQVRLEPDRVEDVVGRKAGRDIRSIGGRRVDAPQESPTVIAVARSITPAWSSAFQTG